MTAPAVIAGSKSIADATFRRLRADILECRLRPGQKLTFDMLRDSYAASFSPLREALSRLSSLGLVTSETQRGFAVATVSAEDLIDLTKLRIWTEAIALRAAIKKGDRAWEADILAALHRVTDRPMTDAHTAPGLDRDWEIQHRAFHHSLVAACGSPRLLAQLDHLYDLTDRYRRLAIRLGNAGRDAAAEHRALAKAVMGRDAATAVALIERHIVGTTEIVLQGEFTNGWDKGALKSRIERLKRDIREGLAESDPAAPARRKA